MTGPQPKTSQVRSKRGLWQITDNLYISGQPKREALIQEKIDVVYTLCRISPQVAVEGLSLIHHYSPQVDGKSADFTAIELIARSAILNLEQGKRVLLHCMEGKNRSGLAAAIILMEMHGINGESAVRIMRERRTGSLYNPHFEQYLLNR